MLLTRPNRISSSQPVLSTCKILRKLHFFCIQMILKLSDIFTTHWWVCLFGQTGQTELSIWPEKSFTVDILFLPNFGRGNSTKMGTLGTLIFFLSTRAFSSRWSLMNTSSYAIYLGSTFCKRLQARYIWEICKEGSTELVPQCPKMINRQKNVYSPYQQGAWGHI